MPRTSIENLPGSDSELRQSAHLRLENFRALHRSASRHHFRIPVKFPLSDVLSCAELSHLLLSFPSHVLHYRKRRHRWHGCRPYCASTTARAILNPSCSKDIARRATHDHVRGENFPASRRRGRFQLMSNLAPRPPSLARASRRRSDGVDFAAMPRRLVCGDRTILPKW